jgi:1-acyl-sn-glycerol-3-phosphate acyltransferase
MVASAGVAIGLLAAGLSIQEIFLVTALMNAAVAVFIYGLVPEFLWRFLAWLLIHTMYRVRTAGLEHVPEEGGCIVVCNHVSYVDAVAIAASVRRPIRFVMDHRIFRTPLLGWIFRAMRTIPIASAREDPTLKDRAFAEAAEALRNGEIVGIFPEGRLTDTGEMNAFRPGVQQMLAATPVPVIPMALSGLWGSFFSRSHEGKAMRRVLGIYARIALVAGPPVAPEHATPEELHAMVLALRGERR